MTAPPAVPSRPLSPAAPLGSAAPSARRLRLAFYGDDFTGASDTLATLAGAGLQTLLFLGVPDDAHLARAGALEALGIAGAARAMDPEAMRAELAPVAHFFATLDARVLHYKCCSTFDSAPQVGNLAVAAAALAPAASPGFLPVIGGQPSLGRYCAFGNLFAAAGDGTIHRLDRHPTMSRHPVTPMHEADLRRHFAALGVPRMGLVDWRTLERDHATIDAAVAQAASDGAGAVLFDALDDMHLAAVGRALWIRAKASRLLVIGASSVAQSLIAHWRACGDLAPSPPAVAVAPARTPVFVLAGSRSPVSAAQVAQAGPSFERVCVDAGRIVRDTAARETLAVECAQRLREGRSVLAYLDAMMDGGPPAHDVALASGALLARVLAHAPQVRRVGVVGGDTSSLAMRALDLWALGHAGTLAPGVPLVQARSDVPALDGLELMLKGGQMGPPDLFDRLLAGIRAA